MRGPAKNPVETFSTTIRLPEEAHDAMETKWLQLKLELYKKGVKFRKHDFFAFVFSDVVPGVDENRAVDYMRRSKRHKAKKTPAETQAA